MLFDDFLYGDVCGALEAKSDYELFLKSVCSGLERLAPGSYAWYFNRTGFVCVDVPRVDLDCYLDFVFDLVGCSHCYLMNGDGLTLMFSLSVLRDCLEECLDEGV